MNNCQRRGWTIRGIKMEPSDKLVDGIVKQIYAGYGGGTGFLFGIPSNQRGSVRAVVKVTLKTLMEKVANMEFKE